MGQTRWLVQAESSTQGSHTHLTQGRRRRRREEREVARRRREGKRTRGELEHWKEAGLLPLELVERLQQVSRNVCVDDMYAISCSM